MASAVPPPRKHRIHYQHTDAADELPNICARLVEWSEVMGYSLGSRTCVGGKGQNGPPENAGHKEGFHELKAINQQKDRLVQEVHRNAPHLGGAEDVGFCNDVDECRDERTDIAIKKKAFVSSQCKLSQASVATSGWREINVCVKCNKGGKLLVCGTNSCSLVIHESCLGSHASFGRMGEFYCPFCAYFQAISKYVDIKKKAYLARKDLANFVCSGTRKEPKKLPRKSYKIKQHQMEHNDGLRKSRQASFSTLCSGDNPPYRGKTADLTNGTPHPLHTDEKGMGNTGQMSHSPRVHGQDQMAAPAILKSQCQNATCQVPGKNVGSESHAEIISKKGILRRPETHLLREYKCSLHSESADGKKRSEKEDENSVVSKDLKRDQKHKRQYTHTDILQLSRKRLRWMTAEEDKLKVIEKCLKSSLNLSRSPQKKRLAESFLEKPTWDPRDVEQLRAVNEALHESTAPMTVMCREDEQNKILDFCKKCVEQEKAGSLYVCGCPGTGKSLSMEKVKLMLVDWANEEGVQPPDILSIYCTSLTNTSEIFSKILGQNHSQKKHCYSTSSLQQLQNLYSQKQPPGMKMILVVADELDYLITKDRAVLCDLFMLTTMPFSKCILLGIANAIDLADRFIPKIQSLNCKPMVVTFCAYSKDQIITILQERLRALPCTVFQPQAVELCARRVAAASGDMRKALAVCRSAIELLKAKRRDLISLSSLERTEDQQKPVASDMMPNQVNNLVRIDHVAAALSKVYKSPVVDTILSLPQHQQIVLCSAVKLFRRGKKDTTLGKLNKSYVDVCKSTLIPPVGIVELSSMCRVLDDQGILKLGESREDKLRRVTLKVDGKDIVLALQGIRFFRNCLQ